MDAWLLSSIGLLLVMLAGLALFYGGLASAKSAVNMGIMSLISTVIGFIVWIIAGYSLVFEGDFSALWLDGIADEELAFVVFQGLFAVIAGVLVSGAAAGRTKLNGWGIFTALWIPLVYVPIAWATWNPNGFFFEWGVLDWAGGLPVHTAAGASALALSLVIGKPLTTGAAHNIPLVVLGGGLLLAGWLGFNAGTALEPGAVASLVSMTTVVGAVFGAAGWFLVELARHRAITSVGIVSGLVAGLVAITPAAAFVNITGAAVVGAFGGFVAACAAWLFANFKVADVLDVVAVHAVAGITGTIVLGLVATEGGGFELLGKQTVAAVGTALFAFAVSILIAAGVKYTIGLRVSAQEELAGVDKLSREDAYVL